MNESDNEYDELVENEETDEDEEADELCSLNNSLNMFQKEETKSRFTEYSMSSSVIKRNEQLRLLDAKFEKV